MDDLSAGAIQPNNSVFLNLHEITISNGLKIRIKNALERDGEAKVDFFESYVRVFLTSSKNYIIISYQWFVLAVSCKDYAIALREYCDFYDAHICPKNAPNRNTYIELLKNQELDDEQLIQLIPDNDERFWFYNFVIGGKNNVFRPGKSAFDSSGPRSGSDVFSSGVLGKLPISQSSASFLGSLIYCLTSNEEIYADLATEINNQIANNEDVHRLPNVAKECAKTIVDCIYNFDHFERIRGRLVKTGQNIKIDTKNTNGLMPEGNWLRYMFILPLSSMYNPEDTKKPRVFDTEYSMLIDGESLTFKLTTEWVGIEIVEGGQGNNYLQALIQIVNKFYSGILRIYEENGERYLCWLKQEFNYSRALTRTTGIEPEIERNLIYFGAPGTGKSFQLDQRVNGLIKNPEQMERVTFHPDYSYSQFVGTYKPVSESDRQIYYTFVPGPFSRVLVNALRSARDLKESALPYFLVIEEINRAKVAAVFGDVFQLLDRKADNSSQYTIQASEDLRKYLASELGGEPEDYAEIFIPDNMFIWATMNSADQGVFPMDTAFKRRWNFKYIGIDDEEITENNSGDSIENVKLIFTCGTEDIRWNVLRRAINMKLSSEEINAHEDKLMGPFFIKCDGFALDAANHLINTAENDKFISVFNEKVLMYLFEDVARTRRPELFSGITDKCGRFSEVKAEFLTQGLAIFGNNFKTDFYDVQEDEYDSKKIRLGV